MIGNRIEYDGRTFNHADIKAGNLYQARALMSDSLEIDTFDVTLSSDTNLTQFTRNAPLTYFYNDSQVGTYYVQNVRRIAVNKYQFSCTSTVGLLEQTDHNGGIYTGQTVQEVVADICGQYPVKVKTNLQGIALYGWLSIASRRDNLSQVLFAIGAALKVDHNGALRVEGLWGDQSASIDEDHMFDKGQVDYGTPVTHVVVTEHQYTQGTEQATLFEGTTSDGDKITFSEPHYNLSATGFTIREQGANYAIVTSGNGKLTGYKYVHSTRTVTKQVTTADSENAVKVENATLVSLANANAVADRLAAYYAHTERVTNDMVLQSESPGDVASLVHPYGGNVQACIESSDINLSGKLRSTEKLLVGYVPPDVSESEYYDRSELITQNQAFTVPDGVKSIRVVLIGGGNGGARGSDGTSGQRSDSGGSGGNGGQGGTGGDGGKLLQQELSVSSCEQFQVTIGQGGAAATAETQPAEGTATTFGDLSSAQGSSSPSGFTDIITGNVYGETGISGVDGGNGGAGGNSSRHGEAGAAVGVYPGGAGSATSINEQSSSSYNGSWVGGGAGGGAAVGTAGTAGRAGKGWNMCEGGDGGNGATPVSAESVSKYGSGGNGGHGGGGGGGGGGCYNSYRGSSGQWAGSGGTGGTGGQGSAGANGCALIYYRIPKIVQSGSFVTRDGKNLLDKCNRKLVV